MLRSVQPGSCRRLLLRLLHVNVGLMLFALSLAAMLRAGVGLGPWDVFHEGLALRTPLTIGQGMIATGFALLAFSGLVARVRLGLGTVMNMLVVGLWVDLFLPLVPAPTQWPLGALLFASGLLLNGAATGLYLTAGLGAGPRDGFALGMARLTGATIARVRTVIELCVVAVGWLLGGTVGAGTLVFALTIGPLMQAGLRLFKPLERAYARSPARPEGEGVAAKGVGSET